jgi:hypothetical protein
MGLGFGLAGLYQYLTPTESENDPQPDLHIRLSLRTSVLKHAVGI